MLTKEEEKQLGFAARFVSSCDASVRIWRWLAPYVPRSEGDLYVAALRKLRDLIRYTLEAEGCSGSAAPWLLQALLRDAGPDAGLAEGLAGELDVPAGRAAACLEHILPALERTPCLEEPVRTALGHYAAAEAFLADQAERNKTGGISALLGSPVPAPVLTAVSRIVYRHISAAEDPGYAVALIRQLLNKRDTLRGDLERYFSGPRTGPVFWNMGAFFSGLEHETDVLELQRYAELKTLLKAFVIVEYRVEQSGKKADAFCTSALCGLVLMLLGDDALRPAQKTEVRIADSVDLRGIDSTALSGRSDYIRALFWMGLERFLPDGDWKKHALTAYREQLAFPALSLSKTDWIILAVVGAMIVYNVIRVPQLLPAALMLLAILGVCYLVFRGGLELLMELLERAVRYVVDRCPWLVLLAALAALYWFLKNGL